MNLDLSTCFHLILTTSFCFSSLHSEGVSRCNCRTLNLTRHLYMPSYLTSYLYENFSLFLKRVVWNLMQSYLWCKSQYPDQKKSSSSSHIFKFLKNSSLKGHWILIWMSKNFGISRNHKGKQIGLRWLDHQETLKSVRTSIGHIFSRDHHLGLIFISKESPQHKIQNSYLYNFSKVWVEGVQFEGNKICALKDLEKFWEVCLKSVFSIRHGTQLSQCWSNWLEILNLSSYCDCLKLSYWRLIPIQGLRWTSRHAHKVFDGLHGTKCCPS